MLKWLFFDLGWTLVDETQAHRIRWDSARESLSTWGINVSTDELMGLSERAATVFAASPFRAVLGQLSVTGEQRETITGRARYSQDHERLYHGVPTLLKTLSRAYSLGVIANQSRGTEDRLKAWDIGRFISLVFASAELGLSKPDQRIFRLSLAQARCLPEEAVLVGDRLDNDIGPAKAQGWRTIRVLQGFFRFQKPRGPYEEPDAVIENLGQLPMALNEIEGAANNAPEPIVAKRAKGSV